MTPIDRENLRRVAEAATPGPWAVHRPWLSFGQMGVEGVIPRANLHPEEPYQVKTEHNHGSASYALHIAVPAHGHSCDDKSDAARNMEHIAAFSPSTALALLDRLEALERVASAARPFAPVNRLTDEDRIDNRDKLRRALAMLDGGVK